jgi:two-component system response regulator YesN
MAVQRSVLVERIVDTIREHYTESITLQHIADRVARHPSYICAVFRAEMGVTVRGYLTALRLRRAAELITRGDKIEAVALYVGYRSKNQFYKQFKRYFGVTPVNYRRNCTNGDSLPTR